MSLRKRVGELLGNLAIAGIALLLLWVAEYIRPLHHVDAYLTSHAALRGWLIGGTIALTVVGAALLALVPLLVRVGDEHDWQQEHHGTPLAGGDGPSRFWGKSVGRSFSDEATTAEVGRAWHARAWRTSPRWRRMFLMILGGIFVWLGLFGLLLVIAPPGVKLLVIAAGIYALATIASIWRRSRLKSVQESR